MTWILVVAGVSWLVFGLGLAARQEQLSRQLAQAVSELAAHALWQQQAQAYSEQVAAAHNTLLEAHNALARDYEQLKRYVNVPASGGDIVSQLEQALVEKIKTRRKPTIQ